MSDKLLPTELLYQSIEECIYNIRGQQVMLDSDVAALFGVETKNINKAMKRNQSRFPEDFCFQLNSQEFKNLRFQNATSNETGYGGRRYLPYVYSEHGIVALAGVLKSDIAAQMSVEIARAFIQMRRFIIENGETTLALAKLQNRQLEFENITNQRFDEIIKKFDGCDIPKEALFYKGQWFDAFDYITKIIAKANKSIVLIDSYCDSKALTFLAHKKSGVDVHISLNKESKLSEKEIAIFEAQYGKINVKVSNDIHDRFLIIDEEECYSLGTSLNYAGNKLFTINEIEDKHIIKAILNEISD